MNKLFLKLNWAQLIFVSFVFLPFCTLKAETQNYCATITWAEGETTDNSGKSLKIGDQLTSGSTLNVGSNSRVKLLLKDDSIIDLGSASQFKLTSCSKQSKQEKIELSLEFGILRASVTKKLRDSSREFKLKTPTSVLGVRGTEFFVRWQKDSNNLTDEQISVLEGLVEVTSLFDKAKSLFKIEGGTEFRAQGIVQGTDKSFQVDSQNPPQVDQFNAEEQKEFEDSTRIELEIFKNETDLESSTKEAPQASTNKGKIEKFIIATLTQDKNKTTFFDFSKEFPEEFMLNSWLNQNLEGCKNRSAGAGNCLGSLSNDGFPIYQAVSAGM